MKQETIGFGKIERNICCIITVPVTGSHKRPPLQPPVRQESGPDLRKSQLRLPLSFMVLLLVKRGYLGVLSLPKYDQQSSYQGH